MKYKLISLRRNPDRLERFKKDNPDFEFELFDAIDGNEINVDEYIDKGWFKPEMKHFYRKGTFGLSISQILCWFECVEKNECVTICCDDIYINKNFKNIVESVVPDQDHWDMIMWGHNPDHPTQVEMYPGVCTATVQIDWDKLIQNIDNFRNCNIMPGLYRCYYAIGDICYTINPRSAQWMIDNFLPVRQYSDVYANYGLDHTILFEMPRMRTYMSIPCLTLTKNDKKESQTITEHYK